MGLTPARAANAASSRTRPRWDQATRTVAAVTGPIPVSSGRPAAGPASTSSPIRFMLSAISVQWHHSLRVGHAAQQIQPQRVGSGIKGGLVTARFEHRGHEQCRTGGSPHQAGRGGEVGGVLRFGSGTEPLLQPSAYSGGDLVGLVAVGGTVAAVGEGQQVQTDTRQPAVQAAAESVRVDSTGAVHQFHRLVRAAQDPECVRNPVCSVVEARWGVAAGLVQTVDQPVDPLGMVSGAADVQCPQHARGAVGEAEPAGFLGELRDVARDGLRAGRLQGWRSHRYHLSLPGVLPPSPLQ